MLRRIFAAAVIVFSFISLLRAQDKFEGTINMKVTANDESNELNYMVKNDNMRMQVNGSNEGVVIFNVSTRKMVVLIQAQKMYMEIPLDKYQKNTTVNETTEEITSKFTNTGETKEINGYKAEKWIFNNDDGSTEAWLTKELGAFYFFSPDPAQQDKPQWQSDIEKQGYFPMLVIHKDTNGENETRFEVTSVEKQKLSDDLFTPPSDFQKMDIPGY